MTLTYSFDIYVEEKSSMISRSVNNTTSIGTGTLSVNSIKNTFII